jgi:hypothetical protein
MRRHTVYALAEKLNLTRIGNERAADKIEKSCLSRTVWPHHTEDLAGLNGQVDILDRRNTAKGLADVIESKKGHRIFDFRFLNFA